MDRFEKRLYAVINKDGEIMRTRGGSSSSAKLMIYPTREGCEKCLKNRWTKQVIPDPSQVEIIKIYDSEIRSLDQRKP